MENQVFVKSDPAELESTIKNLGEKISTAFDIHEAQKEFQQLVETLEEKCVQLTETIKNFEKTKTTLKKEHDVRELQEKRSLDTIEKLEGMRDEINASLQNEQQSLEKVRTEKERLLVLMGCLKTAVEEMHQKIAEF